MCDKILTFNADNAPPPVGHYSQAVAKSGLVFLSGIVGMVPGQGPEAIPKSFEGQLHQVLENLDAVLKQANSSRDHVLNVQVFLTDITFWKNFDTIYAAFFGGHRPARTVVTCPALPFGCMLELNAIASLVTSVG